MKTENGGSLTSGSFIETTVLETSEDEMVSLLIIAGIVVIFIVISLSNTANKTSLNALHNLNNKTYYEVK